MAGKFRLLTLAAIGILPSPLAVISLRALFRYKIGRRVRIGFSVIDASECEIGDDVRIGHLNVFTRVRKLSIGEHTRIGALNIFRGGDEISIGRYCDILRLNEINSIPEPELLDGEADARFSLGDGSMIGASHKIDFTDRVTLGKRVILGGRNSSIWTHNRQQTEPVDIGDYTYLGSEIRIAPGARIPSKCIVGMGSVVAKKFAREYWLIAGVPAAEIKELDEDGRFLTERKTRPDLPDGI
jgi:acetyltransferase-like isoleucine patch superfamily enzyme